MDGHCLQADVLDDVSSALVNIGGTRIRRSEGAAELDCADRLLFEDGSENRREILMK